MPKNVAGDNNKGIHQNIANKGSSIIQSSGSGHVISHVSGTVTINTMDATSGEPVLFGIKKKSRFPVSANTIGISSALVTLFTFLTGYSSWHQFSKVIHAPSWATTRDVLPQLILLMALAALAAVLGGISFFLQKNRLFIFPARLKKGWAGLRESDKKTYPYILKLDMDCPNCPGRKMKFRKKKSETVASCPRNKKHKYIISLTDNDFDKPISR